jgi:hypothetical protein
MDRGSRGSAAGVRGGRRRALKTLTVSDVLSEVDDLMSQEADLQKHPCYAMAAWLLERQLTPFDGAALYDGSEATKVRKVA